MDAEPAIDWKKKGNAFLAEGKIDDAVTCYLEATRATPDDPYAYVNLGYGLIEQQHFEQAADSLRKSIALADDVFDAHYLLGQALTAQGLFEEARDSLIRALELNPNFEIGFREIGQVYERLGQIDEAMDAYRKAIKIKPDFVEVMLNLTQLLLGQKQFGEALVWGDRIVAVDASIEVANLFRAHALHGLGQNNRALTIIDAVLSQDPNNARASHGRGNVLYALHRHQEALQAFEDALAIAPEFADALSSYGVVLEKLGHVEKALEVLNRALALDPTHRHALDSLSAVLVRNGRSRESLDVVLRGLALHPQDPDLHWSRANIELLLGRFDSGWMEYEWRWKAGNMGKKMSLPEFSQPQWTGQPLEGKSIYVVHEQGFGDHIQFLRYAPLLQGRGAAKVYLQVPKGLQEIVKSSADGFQVLVDGDLVPHFDYYCPLMSLPRGFGTTLGTVPTHIPYLHGDPDMRAIWETRLGEHHKPRIGLVWSGSATHVNDHNRSLTLATLLKGAPTNCQFVSLQKEIREHDQRTLAEHPEVLHFGADLRTFSHTAALIECMDVVISVDTSVAHLAGALGRPLWVLLPLHPDWRWLLDRDDSPWYPTARLFRQSKRDDWDEVLHRVMMELKSLPITPA